MSRGYRIRCIITVNGLKEGLQKAFQKEIQFLTFMPKRIKSVDEQPMERILFKEIRNGRNHSGFFKIGKMRKYGPRKGDPGVRGNKAGSKQNGNSSL